MSDVLIAIDRRDGRSQSVRCNPEQALSAVRDLIWRLASSREILSISVSKADPLKEIIE